MEDSKRTQDKRLSFAERIAEIERNPPNERCRLLIEAAKRTREGLDNTPSPGKIEDDSPRQSWPDQVD